jgi:aryl-alcohol dehydrogenase-like predicted oxidoreductase
VLPWCEHHGVTSLLYGSLCRGLLSGKMSAERAFHGDDLRQGDPKFQSPCYAQYLAAVAKLDVWAQERYGKRVIHLAIRWVLDRPGAGVALWGARRPGQLEAVGAALGWSLTREDMNAIEKIVADTVKDPAGPPDFMAPPSR